MRSPRLNQLPAPPPEKAGWPWIEDGAQLPEKMPDGSPWPKVSVITSLYNQEQFVEETIRSVLLQGYPDYEHLIINDEGSSDDGLEVVEKYRPWVRCISRPHSGQSEALNYGFKIAEGDLIGWQNSDDLYGPGSFYHAAIAAKESPDFEVYHGAVRGFQGFDRDPPWLFEESSEFSQGAFLEGMCVMNQSMFFRRSVFDSGLFLRNDLHFALDIEYFWRLSIEGCRFKLVPEMIGYYRQHQLAKSTSNVFKGDREIFHIYRRLVRDKRLDPEIRRKLRSNLWTSLFSAFRKARKNIHTKLVPELFYPV